MCWQVEVLNDTVAKEIRSLPADMHARFLRISLLIEQAGLETMREPQVKQLEGKIWEMRMTGRDGIARALYLTRIGRRVVVLRVFIKKTQKTPQHDIDLALKRKRSSGV